MVPVTAGNGNPVKTLRIRIADTGLDIVLAELPDRIDRRVRCQSSANASASPRTKRPEVRLITSASFAIYVLLNM